MRWFWRLLTVIVLIGLVQTQFVPKSKAFISSTEGQNWSQKIQWELKRWQKISQDLPASIEVEVRRIWQDLELNGEADSV